MVPVRDAIIRAPRHDGVSSTVLWPEFALRPFFFLHILQNYKICITTAPWAIGGHVYKIWSPPYPVKENVGKKGNSANSLTVKELVVYRTTFLSEMHVNTSGYLNAVKNILQFR